MAKNGKVGNKRAYIVRWTESYDCEVIVEAESEDKAMEKAYESEDYSKEFVGTSDWSSKELGTDTDR